MSFGINGPENIPAIQKSHHTNDGGAGNLGYFQQEKKQKEEKEENDVFELSSGEKEEDTEENSLLVELDQIGTRIKNFWLNIHSNITKEKKPEKT